MAFKKGISGNPKGRKRGAKNKATQTTKQWIQKLIDNNQNQLEKDFEALPAKEKWFIMEKLLSYVVPKMKEHTNNINFSDLNESEINEIIEKLTK